MSDAADKTPAKTRVLLVDDHDVVRRGLASLINAEPDLDVCGEADGVESAMEAIGRLKPDVILLDMSLKDGDGLDLLKRKAASAFAGIPALVLSMHDESVYAERAIRAGAMGYVRKANVAETIMTALRRVLSGQVYVSAAVAEGMLQRMSGNRRAAATAVTAPTADRLSDRELQVVRCIGRGLSNREIAGELFISVKTVESHREHIKQKRGLASSGDLLRYAIEFAKVER